MLESAYRLLSTENPLGEGPSLEVPSRHCLSVGQELRGKLLRFYTGESLASFLAELPAGAEGTLDAYLEKQGESYSCVVRRLRPAGLPEWQDPSVPAALFEEMDELGPPAGIFYKTHLDAGNIRGTEKVEGLEVLLSEAGRGAVSLGSAGPHPHGLEKRPHILLLTDAEDRLHLFLLFASGGALEAAPVLPEDPSANQRLPADFAAAAGKTVGIVGLGSVGMKLAASLARSGVRQFVLIEEDVLLPENLVRHDLDWRDVGEHKVHAAKRRLALLAPGVEVENYNLHLMGQESNANVAGALKRLGRCDLIVDATADPGVFNLLAHVAKTYAKPMVWSKIYAGGIGGMVARSRPGLDPSPGRMRAAYHEVIADSPEPAPTGDDWYAAEGEDGEPLVASDADVSIIAGHAAGLALDTMLRPEDTSYPNTMYLVGLKEGWLFTQPFHNVPISLEDLPEDTDEPDDTGAASEGVRFLLELVEKRRPVRVLLPYDVSERLASALRDAGSRETGGVLMGEHVSEGIFRVKDLTVQRRGGTFASFVREVWAAIVRLRRFFVETGHDYTRYNYLGEWHSHPSFPAEPSRRDSETMWRIVEDPEVGANFAVLMIVRLGAGSGREIEGSAWAYLPGRRRLGASLEVEEAT
jgi:molybdopterin/thiamine biosynthesis adenylyltransferase